MRPIMLGGIVLLAACSQDAPNTPVAPSLPVGTQAVAERQSSSGVLNLCKVPGAGVSAGQAFSFAVTWPGNAKNVSVAAGNCTKVSVSFDISPLAKGYFQMHPVVVSALLPGSATLSVGGVSLTSAQVQSILTGPPNAAATSALLLNLAQQVITADLNAVRGLQPPAAVQQAIASANAGMQISLGTPIQLTTSLTAAELGPLVNTISAFNDGKLKLPAITSFAVGIVETIAQYGVVNSIVCDPSSQCSGSNVATGTVTATIANGATTTVTYTNRVEPVLRICKVGGAGIDAGTQFSFTAVPPAGSPSPTYPLGVAAGACADQVVYDGTTYSVIEANALNTAVSDISCDPASRCSSVDLPGRSIAVQPEAGITTVTYTNRSTVGTLRFCSPVVGLLAPADFTYNIFVGSETVFFFTRANECREKTIPEGTYPVNQTYSSTLLFEIGLTGIDCDPTDRCVNTTPGSGQLRVKVVGGSKTTSTWNYRSKVGVLTLCGHPPQGTSDITYFDVSSGGITATFYTLFACLSEPLYLNDGATYTITERSAWPVSQIDCDPESQCSNKNVADKSVSVQIVAGLPVKMDFYHTAAASLSSPR